MVLLRALDVDYDVVKQLDGVEAVLLRRYKDFGGQDCLQGLLLYHHRHALLVHCQSAQGLHDAPWGLVVGLVHTLRPLAVLLQQKLDPIQLLDVLFARVVVVGHTVHAPGNLHYYGRTVLQGDISLNNLLVDHPLDSHLVVKTETSEEGCTCLE